MHNTMKAAPTVSSLILWRGVFLYKPLFAARTCVMNNNKWQRATGSEVCSSEEDLRFSAEQQ